MKEGNKKCLKIYTNSTHKFACTEVGHGVMTGPEKREGQTCENFGCIMTVVKKWKAFMFSQIFCVIIITSLVFTEI